jgi:hypothetical protein
MKLIYNSFLWQGVETLANGFAALAVDLQIPTSLQEVGISQDDLSLLSSEAIKVQDKRHCYIGIMLRPILPTRKMQETYTVQIYVQCLISTIFYENW